MKATVDKKNFKITLDNEAIKAIRFVYGLPVDLRYKLDQANRNRLWDWIYINGVGIFGSDFIEFSTIQATDEKWHLLEVMINDVVRQVLGC